MTAAEHPIDDAAFGRAMGAFAPFEPAPRLALAVSGGADSMALAWLAARWLARRGGEGLALVVDHGLRAESAAEARAAALRCRTLGLKAEVLIRTGPAPSSGIEESARQARYALLEEACLRLGCLHLLTAHHGDDQQETIAMRRASGSGPAGLAGMSACIERPGLRLLRPLLGMTRARLAATARAAGLAWVEDPMNADPRFARARLRRDGMALQDPARPGRAVLETRLAAALPGLVALDRFGVARMDRVAWRALARDLRTPALARIALAVGARPYGPATVALDRLAGALDGPPPLAMTLGGCFWRAGHAHVTVTREARNLPPRTSLAAGVPLLWDGRFLLRAGEGADAVVVPVAALADTAGTGITGRRRVLGLSAAATSVLPAILDLEGLVAVPHLGYARQGPIPSVSVDFRPRHALSPAPFLKAPGEAVGDQEGDGALMWA